MKDKPPPDKLSKNMERLKQQHFSQYEIEQLMGVYAPTYEKVRGKIKQKRP